MQRHERKTPDAQPGAQPHAQRQLEWSALLFAVVVAIGASALLGAVPFTLAAAVAGGCIVAQAAVYAATPRPQAVRLPSAFVDRRRAEIEVVEIERSDGWR